MESEAAGVPPSGVATRLLENQNRLVGWEIADRRAAFGLKLLMAAAALALAAATAWMVWSASRADGLVFTAFSVPPGLAQRGVTGEAVARQVMDRFSAMSEASQSAEAQRAIAADGSNDISIEIPQTGVSIAQLQQWLRANLGRQSRISGELSETPGGKLMLVTRSGTHSFPTLTGEPAALPAMIQQASEAIYAREQPRSYMNWLGRVGRTEEALALARARLTWPAARDRAIGYNFQGVNESKTTSTAAGLVFFRAAEAEDPTLPVVAANIGRAEDELGHVERGYAYARRAVALLAHDPHPDSPQTRAAGDAAYRGFVALATGDFAAARRWAEAGRRLGVTQYTRGGSGVALARVEAGVHDIPAADAQLATYLPTGWASVREKAYEVLRTRIAAQDWAGALAAADAIDAAAAAYHIANEDRRGVQAMRATALVRLGRLGEAEALIGATPLDCQPCVLARAELAGARGRRALADHWFSEASRMAPSLPQADEAWGRALLRRGDPKGALERFAEANRRGPHWADPLEGQGEALLAQGKAKPAIGRFDAAARLAPNWPRLRAQRALALAKEARS